MIRVTCPTCGKGLKCPDHHAGKMGACNDCGETFVIPMRSAEDEESDEPFLIDEDDDAFEDDDVDDMDDDGAMEDVESNFDTPTAPTVALAESPIADWPESAGQTVVAPVTFSSDFVVPEEGTQLPFDFTESSPPASAAAPMPASIRFFGALISVAGWLLLAVMLPGGMYIAHRTMQGPNPDRAYPIILVVMFGSLANLVLTKLGKALQRGELAAVNMLALLAGIYALLPVGLSFAFGAPALLIGWLAWAILFAPTLALVIRNRELFH